MAEEVKKTIEEVATELFKLLEIDGTFEITETDDVYEVVLDTNDTGIVIGYHGDTLDSLQFILSLAVSKKLGEFKTVTLEVGDYKKSRGEWLENLARDTKERVLAEQKEIYLSDLKPWERRIVHLIFQDDQEVVSESVGEGKERVLVIKPKS